MEQESRLPKFHEAFIPVLKILSDGKVLHYKDLRKKVRESFYSNLPKELLDQKTKAGDPLILNRIGWAKAYLKQAGMVHQPGKAMVQITDKGRKILEKGTLTLKELRKDEDFLANQKVSEKEKDVGVVSEELSPQDLIDNGFRTIENQLKLDLLDKLREIDPFYFQKVVLLLLERMGYGDFIETPKSGDGGIDGIINEDKLGLDKIYIQAKRYASGTKVREGEIRNFIGAMSRDSHKGIFVTTSTFDEKAVQKAQNAQQKIILIDGNSFVDLMHKYNVGVQTKNNYEVKEIDEDFFEEE